MSDPRLAIIERRFDKVGKVIAVSSGKGGVGKSMVATCLALNMRDQGYKVGLLDLDFTSPATHVILGVEGLYPEEEYGIIPPLAHDIRYMSITHYSLDEPAPLRGQDVSNAIIELLAITRWEELEFLIATTPSIVAYQSVRRMIVLLLELGIPINGVIENMVMRSSDYVKSDVMELGVEYLGEIAFDESLEVALGDVSMLSETSFYKKIGNIVTLVL
jgi:ATP-binding protein involved in chromosome partitioning